MLSFAADHGIHWSELRNDTRYMALNRHLTTEARKSLTDNSVTVIRGGGGGPTYLMTISTEVDRLEKRWRLN